MFTIWRFFLEHFQTFIIGDFTSNILFTETLKQDENITDQFHVIDKVLCHKYPVLSSIIIIMSQITTMYLLLEDKELAFIR